MFVALRYAYVLALVVWLGGMVVLGSGAGAVANVLAAAAVLLAAINVAGGFLVTQRMLRMFRK